MVACPRPPRLTRLPVPGDVSIVRFVLLASALLFLAGSARAQDTAAPPATTEPDAGPAGVSGSTDTTVDDPGADLEADVAPPEDPEAAARHAEALSRFDDAAVLFERGDFQGALAEMTLVYELLAGRADQYVAFYNLGRIYEELHRYDRAIELYERYLAESPTDGPDRPDAEASLRRLERLLGTLVVTSTVSAEVWIGDALVGEAPGEIRIAAGAHVLELRASGYEPFRREIEVAARTRVEIDATLVRLSDVHGISPAFFVAAASTALVSLGIGLGLGIHASNLHRTGQCLERDTCPELDPDAAMREIRDFALGADLLYGASVLFAVTGVVLGFVTDWGGRPSDETALLVLPVVTPTGASLSIAGRF